MKKQYAKILGFSTLLFSPFASTLARAATPTPGPVSDDASCQGLVLDSWPQDKEGWTKIPSASAINGRTISVTNSVKAVVQTGPLSYEVPGAAEGLKLLRAGHPDQLLFHRGEKFNVGGLAMSAMSGVSVTQPMVISSYGSGARPVLNITGAVGLQIWDTTTSNLAVIGLDFQPTKSNQSGILVQATAVPKNGPITNILFEDIRVQGFTNNMAINNASGIGFKNVIIRRSEILDAWGFERSQGIYAEGIGGLLIEDNIILHNGLRTRGEAFPNGGTIWAHNMYLHSSNSCVRVLGNVSAEAASHGLQARAGGDVINNLFLRDAIGMSWGHVLGGSVTAKLLPKGVTGQVTGNVVWESQDINPKTPRDGGIDIGNALKLNVKENLIAYHVAGPKRGMGFLLSGDGDIGIHNSVFWHNTVYKTASALALSGGAFGPVTIKRDGSIVDDSGKTVVSAANSGMPAQSKDVPIADAGIAVIDNYFSEIDGKLATSYAFGGFDHFYFGGNTYDCVIANSATCTSWGDMPAFLTATNEKLANLNEPKFVDSSRTLGTYLRSLNPKLAVMTSDQAYSAYSAKLRQMDKSNWDDRYLAEAVTSYLREGFTVR